MTRVRPAADRAVLLVAPAAAAMVLLFVYPFLSGLVQSFRPTSNTQAGGMLGNYVAFFTSPRLWPTIFTTLRLAVPATLINVAFALPIAYLLRRRTRYQKLVTTILVVPMTLGTVLIAEGMLTYLGPKGWLSHALQLFHLASGPVRLTHNYTGVLLSLIVSGFPFVFLLLLSYVSGIDPVLGQAAATLGAGPWQQFRHVYWPLLLPGVTMAFCLAFVQAFSVFPSAVLLGAPAGPTRVISIAAYEAAFEKYDYSLASCVAMIMGAVQLVVVAAVLGARRALYRGPVSGGKG